MEHDVIIKKGLLDEEQIEVIQRLQPTPVLHGVGGVGIDLEQNVRIAAPYLPDDLVVEPGPDFHLEPPVAEG